MNGEDYERHHWEDYPSPKTPITAQRLNEMDEQIYENQQKLKAIPFIEVDGKLCVTVNE